MGLMAVPEAFFARASERGRFQVIQRKPQADDSPNAPKRGNNFI
ncbi:MAG: hypothetical protein ABI575_02950 [Oxalobacteraceae bacterium]